MVLIVFVFAEQHIYDKQYKQNRYYRADVESPATEYRTQLIHNQRDRIGKYTLIADCKPCLLYTSYPQIHPSIHRINCQFCG